MHCCGAVMGSCVVVDTTTPVPCVELVKLAVNWNRRPTYAQSGPVSTLYYTRGLNSAQGAARR